MIKEWQVLYYRWLSWWMKTKCWKREEEDWIVYITTNNWCRRKESDILEGKSSEIYLIKEDINETLKGVRMWSLVK